MGIEAWGLNLSKHHAESCAHLYVYLQAACRKPLSRDLPGAPVSWWALLRKLWDSVCDMILCSWFPLCRLALKGRPHYKSWHCHRVLCKGQEGGCSDRDPYKYGTTWSGRHFFWMCEKEEQESQIPERPYHYAERLLMPIIMIGIICVALWPRRVFISPLYQRKGGSLLLKASSLCPKPWRSHLHRQWQSLMVALLLPAGCHNKRTLFWSKNSLLWTLHLSCPRLGMPYMYAKHVLLVIKYLPAQAWLRIFGNLANFTPGASARLQHSWSKKLIADLKGP